MQKYFFDSRNYWRQSARVKVVMFLFGRRKMKLHTMVLGLCRISQCVVFDEQIAVKCRAQRIGASFQFQSAAGTVSGVWKSVKLIVFVSLAKPARIRWNMNLNLDYETGWYIFSPKYRLIKSKIFLRIRTYLLKLNWFLSFRGTGY